MSFDNCKTSGGGAVVRKTDSAIDWTVIGTTQTKLLYL